jgi:hypothetical protein
VTDGRRPSCGGTAIGGRAAGYRRTSDVGRTPTGEFMPAGATGPVRGAFGLNRGRVISAESPAPLGEQGQRESAADRRQSAADE